MIELTVPQFVCAQQSFGFSSLIPEDIAGALYANCLLFCFFLYYYIEIGLEFMISMLLDLKSSKMDGMMKCAVILEHTFTLLVVLIRTGGMQQLTRFPNLCN